MKRTLILALILIASLGGLAARAQDDAVASLWVTLGSVTVAPPGGEPQELAYDDVVVVEVGTEIVVPEDSEALLTFFEGAETRLAAGTTVKVDEFETTESSAKIGLSVLAGQASSSVAQMMDSESRFEINTPAATITVRGTEFLVFVRPNQLTQVATADGLVAVSAGEQEVEVPVGYGVKAEPETGLGAVNVWGQARATLTAPIEDLDNLRVTFVGQDNGQEFFYRSGDLMMVPLGSYDVYLDIPGPIRTEVEFGADTQADEVQEIMATLSVVTLQVVDETGAVVDDAGDILVTLTQGDLVGHTLVTPGDSLLVGSGKWEVELAPADQPDLVTKLEITMEENTAITADVPLSILQPQQEEEAAPKPTATPKSLY